MNKNINILIAIESFWDGGAEIFAIRLANTLADKYNVVFVEIHQNRTDVKKQLDLLDQSKIKLYQLGKKYNGKSRKIINNPIFVIFEKLVDTFFEKLNQLHLLFILKYYKIDIVNSHSWDSDIYLSKLKRYSSFNLVSTFHGHYEFLKYRRLNFDEDTNFSLSQIDHIIYTTESHLNIIKHFNFPFINTTKIFYGIDINFDHTVTKYINGDTLKIVMVARGIKEKGWEEAILAVKLIYEKYPGKVLFNIVGEGDYLDFLKTEYAHEAIIFHGFQSDITSLLIQSDIGILPSFYVAESLPNSIIEYLTCGKPVISTNIGAIKEMIQYHDQMAGFLIDLINGQVDVNTLANAIESYFLDSSLVEKHSRLALKSAEKFTMVKCASEYTNLFFRCSSK